MLGVRINEVIPLIQCVAMYLIFWELINFGLTLSAETIFIQKRYDWD
jgi:hypothetical protein